MYALTCTSQGSGNWNAPGTWSGCGGGFPGAADSVVIAGSHSVTVNVAASCASLSITGTTSSGVTITGQSLSVSGNVTVDGTALANNNSNSIAVGTGTLSVGGSLTLTGGTGNRTAVLSLSTGTATVSGDITGTNASSLITFSGAGTLNVGGSLASGATFTASTGAVIYNGSGAQSVGAYTYNDLTVSKSGGTATLSGNASVAGNLNVSVGTLDLSTFTADRATAGGVISVANSATLKIGGGVNTTFPANYTTRTLGATSTVEYYGTSQNVTNEAYGHLNLAGTGTNLLPNTAMTVAGNLTLSGSATADTQAAVTVNGNVAIGTGTTFLARTFTHNVKGNLSNSGTLTPASSTFNFNGTSAQSIAGPVSFFNLTLANAAGVTGSGAITVQGNFTNTAGFAAGTSTVTFNGSSAQSLTGTTTFNNLTMNNAAGLSNNSDVSVSGVLTFTNGNISTGSNVLSITSSGSVSRTSGHVVGRLRKNIATGVDVVRTFEIGTGANFTPVLVTFDSVSVAGDLTATVATPDHPQIATSSINPDRSVNRYWTLNKDGALAFVAYTARFTFVAGDVDAGSNTANFIVQRFVSPTWFTTTLISPLPTSTEAGNITDVGDFAVGQPFITSFSREKEFVFSREVY